MQVEVGRVLPECARSVPAVGVSGGHVPPENFQIFDLLRWLLVQSEDKIARFRQAAAILL